MAEPKKKMSIRRKLLTNHMIVVILLVLIGIIGIYDIHEVYSNGNKIYENNMTAVNDLMSISQNIKEIDQCVISMMSSLDEDYHQEYIDKIQVLQAENEQLMAEYEQLDLTPLEERRYNQCRLSILTFNKQINNLVEQIEDGNLDSATRTYEQELMPVKACTYELLDAVVELASANAHSKSEENRRIYSTLIWLIIAILIISVVVSVIISMRMNNYFIERLNTIRRLAKRISEYNVSDDISDTSNDEFGETMAALNDSQMMMRNLLEKIINESTALNETGEEVSLAVRKSSQRIETTNVKVYNSESGCKDIHEMILQILEDRELDEETVLHLKELLATVHENQALLKSAQTELTSIAMYLEQIGITMDYQNEIASEHQEQVLKFKI